MKPTLAIVEDRELILNLYKYLFQEKMGKYGLKIGFDVDHASNKESAKRMLWKKWEDNRPLDVLVIDLGLPIDATSTDNDRWESGVELIEEIRAQEQKTPNRRIAKSIVVSSVNFRTEALQRLLSTQIVDEFVDKSTDDRDNSILCRAVATAYRQSQRNEWQVLKQKRLVQLLQEMNLALCGRLTRVVTNSVSNSLQSMRTLSRSIENVTGIDLERDIGSNPICDLVQQAYNSITQTKDLCLQERDQIQSALRTTLLEKKPESLSDVLDTALEMVSSGLIGNSVDTVKNISSESSQVRLGVSVSYTKVIVHEMLFGVIDSLVPECDEDRVSSPKFQITSNLVGKVANLTILYSGANFSKEEIESIRDGDFVRLVVGSQPWGLALVSYIAQNIGCDLMVENSGGLQKITLRVPVVA